MTKTLYVSLSEVNNVQTSIMEFVDVWVHTEKTPVPLKEIISTMLTEGIKSPTTIKAINVLLKKGYIRRAIIISNKSSFVQLKRV